MIATMICIEQREQQRPMINWSSLVMSWPLFYVLSFSFFLFPLLLFLKYRLCLFRHTNLSTQMKLLSGYLDTLGEEKGKSRERRVEGIEIKAGVWFCWALCLLGVSWKPLLLCCYTVLFSLVSDWCNVWWSYHGSNDVLARFWLFNTGQCLSPMMILVVRRPEGWVLPFCALLAAWCFLKEDTRGKKN